MRFTLSNLLLSLALFPLLIQGAPLPKGIEINSTGPVVLPVLNSGEDGGKSRRGVGPKIAQRHPQVGTLGGTIGRISSGLGAGLGDAASDLGAGLGGAVGGLGAGLGGAASSLGAGLSGAAGALGGAIGI